jgi:hypothetical protein
MPVASPTSTGVLTPNSPSVPALGVTCAPLGNPAYADASETAVFWGFYPEIAKFK